MQLDLDDRTIHNREELIEYHRRRGTLRELRIPFLSSEVGLGDAVARLTSAFGVQPCGGCQQRREQLNGVRFTPWHT